MKKTFTSILLFTLNICICSISLSQPAIDWQNTIGGNNEDDLLYITQTNDGGYISGGHSYSNASGDKMENNFDTSLATADYWIVKTDSLGNIQWQNTIGGSDDDLLYSVQQTTDGGYILGGSSSSNISGDKTENNVGTESDYWIVKTDAGGNIQWQNTIGGSNDDELYSVRQTTDGGYILGGFSSSNISGDKTENRIGIFEDYWVVKLNPNGNIQWQNTIGGTDIDMLYTVEETSDGGYILGGWSDSEISGDKTEGYIGQVQHTDYWIVKINSSGNILWQNTIGGDGVEGGILKIRQTADGGYILMGSSDSNISGDKTENCIGNMDYWLVKLNSTGDILWENTIGGSEEDIPFALHQTSEGGYILGGMSASNISGDKTENRHGSFDYWIVKTDPLGTLQWESTIGGDSADLLTSITETNEGGYILGGASNSNISVDKTENCMGISDFWIVKLAPDSTIGIAEQSIQNLEIKISPNPFVNELKVQCEVPGEIIIYDVFGRIIYKEKFSDRCTVNTVSWSRGIYFVEIVTEKGKVVRKLVKQ